MEVVNPQFGRSASVMSIRHSVRYMKMLTCPLLEHVCSYRRILRVAHGRHGLVVDLG